MDLEVDAMKFGMPALLEHGTLAEDAALCRELGLDFIELNLNVPQYQPGRWDAHGICRVGEEYGVDFTIHLDENLNVAEMNTIVGYVYDMLYGEGGGYPSFASAAAIILFVIVLTITCINLLVSRKHVHY